MRALFCRSIASLLLLAAGSVWSLAADQGSPNSIAPASSQQAREAEAKAAWEAALAAAIKGPAEIPFLSQATLKLPPDFLWLPVSQSNRLMRAWGNRGGGDGFVGLVLPADTTQDWFITADFVDAGYVKDEEAKHWDADELLKLAREGVDAENEDRVARGFPKIKVDGWIERPIYDPKEHRLVYSTALSDVDAKPGDESSVNYHTYALGRDGYFALDLVTGTSNIDRFKDRARTVLAALNYAPGKGYENFVAGTDRIAEYGIAALIGGLAAKKLGLLALGGLAIAKFGGTLVAFAKPIGVAVVGVFAGIARFFRRKPPPGR